MSTTDAGSHLSVLFVDDRKENFIIGSRLERAFDALGCAVTLVYESDLDMAYQMVSEKPQRFGVIITDLLFRDIGDTAGQQVEEPRGPDFIRHIRAVHRDTVIVAVTTQLSVNHPDLGQLATDAGANRMLLRGMLRSGSTYGGADRLALEIHRLAREFGLIAIRPRLNRVEEPGVESVIEDVGEATLSLLLSELSPVSGLDPVSVSLTYVTPGASGARVLRADAEMPDGGVRTLLVKLGQDREALACELANSNQVQGRYSNNLVVHYVGREPASRNGWSAIATEFTEDARTLRQWLSDADSAPHVGSLFERLFLGRGLASGYRAPKEENRAPIEALMLPAHRRVRVRAAVEELAGLLDHPEGIQVEDSAALLRALREFSRDGRIVGVPMSDLPTRGLVLVNAHGDLHGGNILVYDDRPRPLIIDLASYDWHHWAYDVARIVADIILRVLDSPVEYYFWRRFSVWRRIALEAGNFAVGMAADPLNPAAVAALNWLGEHSEELLPELAKPERRWEWHVALAEQLLRSTYQPHLPTPKRVLGMVAAYDQLVLARSNIRPSTDW